MPYLKHLLMLTVAALPWLPAFAQQMAADDCARARDPERCEARQAALKACSEKRAQKRRLPRSRHAAGGLQPVGKSREMRSHAEGQGSLQGQDRQGAEAVHAR
jgi:hypothetical protein